MTSTIDSAGRVVIPKVLRDSLGIKGAQSVTIRERDGVIEIVPVPFSMELVDRGKGLVAVPGESLPSLTIEMVRETIDRTRR